jgi:hypothetical protein
MSETARMLAFQTMVVASSVANGDIRPLLRAQGFEGPINGRERIGHVGDIREGPDSYGVYLYRGVFRAAAVDHGVNRLIVILNGSTFYGAYDASMTRSCMVRARKVICDTGIVEVTKRGPPDRIYLDGQVEEIARALMR